MCLLSDAVLRSAMASKLAYARNTSHVATFPMSKQLLADPGKFAVVDCGRTGAHAYIWKTGDNSNLVSFRGSHNIGDILKYVDSRDMTFNFCDRQMKLHKNVYDMFASIEPLLTDILFEDGFTRKRHLTFCGHSLGGAMAMFASAYYSHMTNKKNNIVCHTFGAPKIGNWQYMDWFDAYVTHSVHVQNTLDLVTIFTFNGEFVDSSAGKTVRMPYTSLDLFKNHDLDTYIDNIRNDIRAHNNPFKS